MENIIQQIALDLVEKITKKLFKEKNRKRSILTELGTLNLPRDYFFDKTCDRYVFVLDAMLGLQRYERISGNVRTRLVTEACEVSYAKSAQIVTGGSVSRQSVGNAIRKLTILEKEPDWIEKKKVKELHVYADEDHVHLQKPKKEAGKKGKIVPLVSVTEGTESNGRRRKTICPMHFVDEHFDSKALWNTVEGYIRNNWEEIVRRKRLDIPGSCTEGQISHVLSERFSRDPMGWSEECLGKLSQARVYLKNGGTLTKEDFKGKDEKLNGKEKYREYAQRMMKEAGEGCFDWSIFEKPIIPMDKASGTQILIESLGESRNILYC